MGSRAFSCAAPNLWNSLPQSIRESDCLTTFKSCLTCLDKLFLINFKLFIVIVFFMVMSYDAVRKIILCQTENKIIFLTPLADYFACFKQKLT